MIEQTMQSLKRPASTEQLAAEIRAVSERRGHVFIQGSASTAIPPTSDACVISTLRLNKILEYAVADMTVIVHAGITLEALQRHLAWQNQWLPVDPPAQNGRLPGQRTIGGLIATNSLGPLRLSGAGGGGGSGGGGDWRLLIMGMKYVDASGTLITAGGRTVKNVAGYALHRLHIGANGSLGAIAEVTLRTFARPADEQCVILFCPDPGSAEALLAEILGAPVTPACIQLVGGKTFAANPLQLPTPSAEPGAMALIVGFLGRPAVCAAQIEVVRNLPAAREHRIDSIAQTAAQAGRLRLWMTSEPAPRTDHATPFRLLLPSSRAAEAIAALESAGHNGTFVVSEAATALIRGVFIPPDANPRETLTGIAQQVNGTLIIPGTPRAPSDIERRLQKTLDPMGIFPSPK